MRKPSQEIQRANEAIERALSRSESEDRGCVAQDVLKYLRDLVEHIAIYTVYEKEGKPIDTEYYMNVINASIKEMGKDKNTKFIRELHDLLAMVSSHYTPTVNSAERLLIGIYDQLYMLREYAKDQLSINILTNLEAYPIETDQGLVQYYQAVVDAINTNEFVVKKDLKPQRYYIYNEKPFFVDGKVYYELTLTPAYDSVDKSDHVIAFSSTRIPMNTAVMLHIKEAVMELSGIQIPIYIVDYNAISIRPIEIDNLLKILGIYNVRKTNSKDSNYKILMNIMSYTGMSLNEIVCLSNDDFDLLTLNIKKEEDSPIWMLLSTAHKYMANATNGKNVLSYLFYHPRNAVICDQMAERPNNLLGNLWLDNGCIPFDKQPFCTSLINHKPRIQDVYHCIDSSDYISDHLARNINNLMRDEGSIYIDDTRYSDIDDLDNLIDDYNSKIYSKHQGRLLMHEMKHLFFKGVEDDIVNILKMLTTLSKNGINGYNALCEAWLQAHPSQIDQNDDDKVSQLKSMYLDTSVALIYGSAGTGKTTMIDHICNVFDGIDKIAIANTHSAVYNLKMKVHDNNCQFMTTTKYINDPVKHNILIIDECSTVSNRDMAKIADAYDRGMFNILLLVGDIRQLEAIDFGNWFELAKDKDVLPNKCIHEFNFPCRTTDQLLKDLWSSVRENSNEIEALLEAGDMSSDFDETICQKSSDDEIILCLNYDGPYGINSINQIMQESNPGEKVEWDLHTYKIGDPILFDESNRFSPLLYTNLKGQIVNITIESEFKITFEVTVERVLSELNVYQYPGLEFIKNDEKGAVLRFSVYNDKDMDEIGEKTKKNCIVPFRVAYATSVHKAQGLEYSSVKLIITNDVENRVTHNLFYTAISRAREKLKIYWSPETEKEVLSHLKISNITKDVLLLKNRRGKEIDCVE